MESFVIPGLAGFAGNLLTEAAKSIKYLPSLLGDKGNQSDTLQNLEFSKNNDLVASKSYTCAFCEIMDALKDDKVNTIGVWGMGGVGKTTLVTAVGCTVKALQLFDKIIMVVVSQKPDVGKIQDKIADFLKLKFETKTQQGKAGELWDRLEKEEKVLIVLDDLWKEINLKEIGIPLGGNGKGCKIILTTRRKPVCESMARQVKAPLGVPDMTRYVSVPLDVLDKDDAWTLFKKKASLNEDKNDVETIDVAKKVAKECKGLPVAIVTLASALKDANTLEDWEIALKKLESNRLMEIRDIEKDENNAYMCLQTSYEYLTDTTKKLFLLCALYPEDCSIDPEELVRYAWGLELYPHAESIKEVRVDVLAAITCLKESCLLLEIQERSDSLLTWDDYEDYMYTTSYIIKMHDMVRDVARWIASKEDNGFVKKSGVGVENEISKQKLKVMLPDNYDRNAPIDYFKGMPELKVLSLKASDERKDVFSLKALESLTDLRVLQLVGYKWLQGISALAKLTKLEILYLRGSSFEESVEKLGELTNLRVLDIHECNSWLGFPPNLIQRLVKTEELYLYYSDIGNISTAILPELHFLPKLDSLSLKIYSPHFPHDFEVSEIKGKNIQCLTDTTPGNVALVEKILQNLKLVDIIYCGNLQVIFQMEKTEIHALLLSKLKALRLQWLPDLEYIWKMPTQHVRLHSLEAVRLRKCGKLKSVFSFSLAQCLLCLQLLVIELCDELKQIVEELEGDEQETSANRNPNKSLCLPKLKTLNIWNCERLEYIFPNFMASQGLPQLQKLSMQYLPQLKQICRPAMQREENSIFLSQPQELLPSLTELKLRDCPELIDALVIPKEANLEGVELSKLRDVLFTNTKTLFLQRINGAHNLIPEVDKEGLNKLAVLAFHNCSSFEYLIDRTKKNVPNRAFTNLAELSLTNMDGLKMLCNGQSPKGFLQNLQKLTVKRCDELQELFKIDASWEENRAQPLSNLKHYFSLQNLKVVNISECGKLKFLFSPSLIQSLRQLEKLQIEDCAELKTLFAELESVGETESNSHLHPLCLPRLTTLNITRCERLEYVLPITLAQEGIPQLEQLQIRDCAELKTLFAELESLGETESSSHLHSLCFPRLTTLNITRCERLEYVLPITLAQGGLPQLEQLLIADCAELKTLFAELESVGETESNSHLHSLCLPRLTTLYICKCERLEYVFPITLAQGLPLLESVWVFMCPQLKQVFGGLKNLSGIGPENYFITLPALEGLEVVDCPRLTNFSIQQDKALRNLPQLWCLKIKRCEKVEKIIGDDDTSASSSQGHDQLEETTAVKNEKQVVMFSKLKVLELKLLPNLVSFNPVGYHLIFSSLRSLEIQDCPQIITSFIVDSVSLVHAQTKVLFHHPILLF
ncbi:hypothetical protein PTKIN_Ptkin14bG0008700 [Pterospermum kingtungense]